MTLELGKLPSKINSFFSRCTGTYIATRYSYSIIYWNPKASIIILRPSMDNLQIINQVQTSRKISNMCLNLTIKWYMFDHSRVTKIN